MKSFEKQQATSSQQSKIQGPSQNYGLAMQGPDHEHQANLQAIAHNSPVVQRAASLQNILHHKQEPREIPPSQLPALRFSPTPVLQGVFSIARSNSEMSSKGDIVKKESYIYKVANNLALSHDIPDIVKELIAMATESNDLGTKSWENWILEADNRLTKSKKKDKKKDKKKEKEIKYSEWEYDSDIDADTDQSGLIEARALMSPDIRGELGGMDLDDFRDNTAKVVNKDTGYTVTSSKNSNLVAAKGYNTAQSEYKNVIANVAKELGVSQGTLAKHLLNGLYDTAEFNKTVKSVGEKVGHKLQFLLGLLHNEILGRTTSNLLEITAILSKTSNVDDNDMFRRFQQYSLLTPNQSDHGGIGGQKLSRIGHKELDVSSLDTELKELLQQNQNLYAAIAQQVGAKSHEDLEEKLKPLYKQFGANFIQHFSVNYPNK